MPDEAMPGGDPDEAMPGGDPWDEVAEEWDRDAGPRAYAAAAYDSLLAELAARSKSLDRMRVLDFGAGTGLLTELLVHGVASIVASDTSAAMRERLEAKAANWPAVSVVERVPGVGREAAPFDLIVCSSVLGFVDDYPATAARLIACLAPGGVFVQWDWEREHDPTVEPDDPVEPGDRHGLTRAEVSAALTDAGLSDVAVKTGFMVAVDDIEMRPLMGSGIKGDGRR